MIKAAAEKARVAVIAEVDIDRSTGKIWAKWDTRPSPRRGLSGNKVSGRGIAYAQRNGTRKFTVAHDCGQIINPDGLVKCIEGNIVQGVSRTLWEEVDFRPQDGD